MSENKYIDDLGVEYDTQADYCNSPNLDFDIIYNYLARGKRTPQNIEEKTWQKGGKQPLRNGGDDISFD
ncbi:hypothetical protein [Polaribacter irgensii]|nr:hypothetical protein [Polaribacter irgensii]